ncbi:MmyB family transcriptional regulator [Streptomyces mutomycini]|uniref:MmyB family transcriptional regulator n=1 Tax=Streptomyces mutomycini TaxID=284036 RepID=UPI0033F8C20C
MRSTGNGGHGGHGGKAAASGEAAARGWCAAGADRPGGPVRPRRVAFARHEVAQRFEDHKTRIHPELGPIELDCQALFTEDRSRTLLVLTAQPRTDGYEKLQFFAVLGPARFTQAER